MGLFDMSPLDLIEKVTNFSQKSLDNTLGTIKEVHQAVVEIPINVAQDLGLPADKASALKDTHRRILDHVHAGVSRACEEVNRYVLRQAQAVNELADYAKTPLDPNVVELRGKSRNTSAD